MDRDETRMSFFRTSKRGRKTLGFAQARYERARARAIKPRDDETLK